MRNSRRRQGAQGGGRSHRRLSDAFHIGAEARLVPRVVPGVFIIASGPKKSGCRFVTGWMAQSVKAGASPGGYAVGSLLGIRCDEPLPADQGPLGGKYTQYNGVIHCEQVDESAVDPQGQLDSDPAGIWGYYGSNVAPKAATGPPAGPAIRGATLGACDSGPITYWSIRMAKI